MGRKEEMSIGKLINYGINNGTVYVDRTDHLLKVIDCHGTTIPTTGAAGYAMGCVFRKTNAANGQCPMWRNIGSSTSCLFVPFGPVLGYGMVAGGWSQPSVGGDTTEYIYDPKISTGDISFAEHQISDDNDTIAAQIAGTGVLTITASADPTAGAKTYGYMLARQNIVPMFDIFAAGSRSCLDADDDTVAVTVTGAEAGDIAMACFTVSDDTDTIEDVVASANGIVIGVSADPGSDGTHAWDYVVFRKRGSFKPSHYIFAAGVHTTTADAGGANDITVTGMLATDLVIVQYNTTDDTDTIVKAVAAAGKITVTMSADPSTAHKLAYMVLRAY